MVTVGVCTTANRYLLVITTGCPEPMVAVKEDGTIVYGKDYDPDKAAQIFWEAMATNARKVEAEAVRRVLDDGQEGGRMPYYVIQVAECPSCKGGGTIPLEPGVPGRRVYLCPACNGTGETERRVRLEEALWAIGQEKADAAGEKNA